MSLRQAINDYCKWCVYDPANGGTWRQQVEACPCQWCPLYEHRPVTTETTRKRANQKHEGKADANH